MTAVDLMTGLRANATSLANLTSAALSGQKRFKSATSLQTISIWTSTKMMTRCNFGLHMQWDKMITHYRSIAAMGSRSIDCESICSFYIGISHASEGTSIMRHGHLQQKGSNSADPSAGARTASRQKRGSLASFCNEMDRNREKSRRGKK